MANWPAVDVVKWFTSSDIPDSNALRKLRGGIDRTDAVVMSAIFLLCLTVYFPALQGELLWDDHAHLTAPRLQSLDGLWRIWTEFGATQQYYPVLHSAFWVEHRLWGNAVSGYHLTNTLLHAIAACLVVCILRRLQLPGAWLAGLMFTVHPVCVESVAWISEQKNTLSGVFYLSSAWVYLRFDETRRTSSYILALGLFTLALLSKSVTATLPAALLLVFWWRRGRINWKLDTLPLIPWVALGTAAGLVTAWVERTFIGAVGSDYALTFLERCLLAGRIIWFYLAKLVWPSNLTFIYPRWTVDTSAWWQYLFSAGVLVLVTGLGLLARRHRGPLAGFLFFAGTLFPVLGFLNVYPFRYSYVADHFQYLAMLGIIAPAAAGATAAFSKSGRTGTIGGVTLSGALVLVLAGLTWNQSQLYRDRETFWRTTVQRNPGSSMAFTNLGNLVFEKGLINEGTLYLETAVRLKPDSPEANGSLGSALSASGRSEEAIPYFRKAIELQPNKASFHGALANELAATGRIEEAIREYEAALALNPEDGMLSNNFAWALATSPQAAIRNGAKAVEYAERAVRLLGGEDFTSTAALSAAYAEAGRFQEAIAAAEKARALAIGRGNAKQAEWVSSLLELYRSGQPYHGR